CASFIIHTPACDDGAEYGISLSVPGRHNVLNAAAAFAAARLCGIGAEEAVRALHGYTGVDRRFQTMGELNGVEIIDDYAHHPTEIRATLAAAKRVPHDELWLVFQPHTYTRTKALLPDFADALKAAVLRHGDLVLEKGVDHYSAEVSYTQGTFLLKIISLVHAYQLSGEAKYLEPIPAFLKNVEGFCGQQPDFHVNLLAVRYWDLFWVGKMRISVTLSRSGSAPFPARCTAC
ncbi:MAG: hypothetical protein IJK97_05730, partial [Thermoguttaceae bacterium]|nr:hypothetical protein [Thermoguttaceae bacterium]